MANEKGTTMADDLNSWGGGLIIMGIIHFFVPLLAAQWGIVLIVLGILSFVLKHRFMFIALGASLIFIGLMNLLGSLNAGPGFWSVFGCLQVYWGIKEMCKVSRYRNQTEGDPIQVECATMDFKPSKEF